MMCSPPTPAPTDATPCPLARLPPELLLVIVEFTMNPWEYHTDRIFQTITYTHVCRHWRALLLGAPDLWTLVDLRYPVIAREFCIRSQSCPIRLSFDQTGPTVPQDLHATFGWLSPHVTRIEGLSLAASQTTIRDILSLIVPKSTSLKRLRDSLSPDDARGPTLLVGIHAHEVQRLNLSGFKSINWSMPFEHLAGLTCLALTRLDTQASLSVPRLLSLLTRCPGLKTFVLQSALSSLPTGALKLPTVELPALESLEVAHGYFNTTAELLAHLVFPRTTSMTFHAHGVKDLSALLPENFGRHGSVPDSSRISDAPVTTLCRVSPSSFMITMHRPRTSSTLRFFIAPDDLPDVLRNLASLKLLVSGCTHLHAVSPQPATGLMNSSVSMGTWKAALSAMPTLRHIETGGAWASSLLFALVAATGQPVLPFSPPTAQCEIACPALESIHLVERFRADVHTQQFLENLAWTLESRHGFLGKKLSLFILETRKDSARALMSAMAPRFMAVVERVDIRSHAATPISLDSIPVTVSMTVHEVPSSSSQSEESKRRT
ncbi:hypothetical protein DAEQUDRAFT_352582 [Daedalea quercina L-15889]|uniref:Uncharacterized protein n=1 Tax=Daedalea quercina L-15889 TaxID=1314783 RepID=A0A165TPF4_9APHY|nr:hypothetical protein DAEQUDRAFT_352582 [Daedalea quercina L-15889]